MDNQLIAIKLGEDLYDLVFEEIFGNINYLTVKGDEKINFFLYYFTHTKYSFIDVVEIFESDNNYEVTKGQLPHA